MARNSIPENPSYTVRLLKPHEHEEREYPEGALLTVDRPTRDFLQEHGVIESPAKTVTTEIKGN